MSDEGPRPSPNSPNPSVVGDPFWGPPPWTHAYVAIGALTLAFLLAVALIVIAVTR